jgi:hypothetical protein
MNNNIKVSHRSSLSHCWQDPFLLSPDGIIDVKQAFIFKRMKIDKMFELDNQSFKEADSLP